LYIQLGNELIVEFLGTLARLFPGKEFRVHEQTVFQVVNANGSSFPEADEDVNTGRTFLLGCQNLTRRGLL
jgi:hypothetical protein